MEHVREILHHYEERGISLNREKFKFCCPQAHFAGFMLTSEGYFVSNDIDAITNFPPPSSCTDLHSLIGLTNLLATCTKELTPALTPLQPLLSIHNDFLWTPDHAWQLHGPSRSAISSLDGATTLLSLTITLLFPSHRLDKIENPRLQHLRMWIMGYNFTTQWLKGANIGAANALSRHPHQQPADGDDLPDETDTHHSQTALCQGLSIAQIRASTLLPPQQENLHLQNSDTTLNKTRHTRPSSWSSQKDSPVPKLPCQIR